MQFALLVRLGYSWYRNCLCALNNSKLKHKQLRSMDRKSYHIIYLSSQISSSLYSDCGIELSFSAGIMYLSLPIRIISFYLLGRYIYSSEILFSLVLGVHFEETCSSLNILQPGLPWDLLPCLPG